MNVSSTPTLKPPVTLNVSPSASRPVRPLDTKLGGAPDVRILPPTTNKPSDAPSRPAPRGGEGQPGGGGTPVAPTDMFNIDGLLADWGKSDSPYDLDGSGSVDAWDLALFQGGQRPKSDEPTYNLEGLMQQWGRTDSPYDLDGSGSVDAWDLALFLGGERPQDPTATPPANDPTNTIGGSTGNDGGLGGTQESQAAQQSRPAPADGEAFLERFARVVFHRTIGRSAEIPLDQLKVDDQQAAKLDPDGDGIVKRADLKQFIKSNIARQMEANPDFRPRAALLDWVARLGGPRESEALTSHPGTPEGKGVRPADADNRREAALQRLSSFVSNKLEGAGFRDHPPRNLHAVIGKLNVTGADRDFLLKQLSQKYPNGLGINHVG